jgi:hypothetical protein
MRGKFPVSFQITPGPTKHDPAEVKVNYADDKPALGTASTVTPSLPPGPDGALTGKAEAGDPSLVRQEFSSPPACAPLNSQDLPPDFSRHARRCCICSHPDRDAIEGEFVRWASPRRLAKDYHIADRVSLYRHAHATGLFPRRKREFARVLEDILECVEHSSLEESADVIIRAARVYAHLDENGNWFEPPRTHIILTGPAPPQFAGNSEIAASDEPQPNAQPGRIPLKLARKLTRGSKAKKRLIATHPNSKNGPTP